MASTLHLIVLNFFLSLIPIVEAKFTIPFTISRGLHPALAFLSSLLAGIFGAIILFLFLDFIHARLLKYSFYKRSFNYAIVLIRKKEARIKDKMNKYGYLALIVYVAIPLPIVGVYSGCIIAWLLNLPRRKSILAISIGAAISTLLVTLASVGIISAFFA